MVADPTEGVVYAAMPGLEVDLDAASGPECDVGHPGQKGLLHGAVGFPADSENSISCAFQSECGGLEGVEYLRGGITSKIANARGSLIRCRSKHAGRQFVIRRMPSLELIVLTVEAVEGAGPIEHGQVLIAYLGALRYRVARVAAASARRTDKRADTVGW